MRTRNIGLLQCTGIGDEDHVAASDGVKHQIRQFPVLPGLVLFSTGDGADKSSNKGTPPMELLSVRQRVR